MGNVHIVNVQYVCTACTVLLQAVCNQIYVEKTTNISKKCIIKELCYIFWFDKGRIDGECSETPLLASSHEFN